MIEGKVVEVLDNHNEGTALSTFTSQSDLNLFCLVGYYAAKMPTGITNRDFCNQRAWRANKEKGKRDGTETTFRS